MDCESKKSVFYGVVLQSVIINGEVLGMDLIQVTWGLKIKLLSKDASGYPFWCPKLSTIKFVCNCERSVIVSCKSGDRALWLDLY